MLIMVLGMLMLMSMIVSLFLNDVMEASYLRIQLSGKTQLRHQAYNALNYVICQIEQSLDNSLQFNDLKGGKQEIKLKGFDSVNVYVQLFDESGKYPLNKSKLSQRDLKPLFCLFGDIWDGQLLAQSYLNWLKRKPIESQLIDQDNWNTIVKKIESDLKNKPDQEAAKNRHKHFFPCCLNTYEQLKEIDKFREIFFDKKGNSNEKMEQLKQCSSMYNVGKININSVNKDTLEALSKNYSLDLDQMENYLGLLEEHKSEPKFYQTLKEINKLGHGELFFKTRTDRDLNQIDCRDMLSVEPNTIRIIIIAEEVDSSFLLRVVIGCEKQILTKRAQKSNIWKFKVHLKALEENYL